MIQIDNKFYIKAYVKYTNGEIKLVDENGIIIALESALSYAFVRKQLPKNTVILVECDENGEFKRREKTGSLICKQFTKEEQYKQALLEIRKMVNKNYSCDIDYILKSVNI